MKTLRALGARWRRALACAGVVAAGLLAAGPGSAQPVSGEAAATPQPAATRWITLRSDARDLAVSPAGDVLALDEAGDVWRLSAQSVREGRQDAWALQPGRFVRLRATLDGTLWGIDASAVLYRLVGSVWRPLAEGVRDVATTPDGVVMLLTTDKRLLYPDLQQVLALPADATPPDRLIADEHGQPWLRHTDGRVSRWTGRKWVTAATASEGLRDIAISADGTVLAVGANGALLQRLPQAGAWQVYGSQSGPQRGQQNVQPAQQVAPPNRLPGTPPARALRVVLDASGLPWLLDATGSLHAERLVVERSALAVRPPALFTRLLAWRPLGGLAQGVALGPDGSAFSLTREGSVHQWLGENRWSAKGGNFQSIAVGAKGAVWGLDARGAVYALDQGFWLPLPLVARHIAAGPANSLWAAMPDDSLMRWNPAARQWALVLPLPEKVRSLAIGPAGEPWVIDATGTVQFMQGREWKAVAGIAVAGLSVGPEGTVYAIDAADQSLQWLDKRDLQWRPASGQAVALSVGAEGALWIVAPGNTLMASGRFLREEAERQEAQRLATALPPVPVLTIIQGVLPTLQRALTFQTVQAPNMVFQDIGIGANGAVFALGSEGGLFCFSNASRQFQLATLSKATRVAVNPAGQPWLLNQSGVVSSFDKGVWRTVPEFLGRDIAVGPDGQAWAVDLQGAAFRYSPSTNRFERLNVASSDAPNKATRIAGAAGSVYWTVTESNQLMRCERGDCRIQLLGVQDVTVAPDSTVLLLDLLGAVRRFNPTTKQFEKQNGLGRSIAAGPQGLPWLVTADGKVSYAGLFFPGSRSVNTDACAAPFSQAPAPIEPPSATLRLADVAAALLPGTSVDLLQQGKLNGRPLALGEVSIALNTRTPWLSLQQGSVVLAPNVPPGSLLEATYTVCPLRQAGTCVTARLAVSVGTAPAAPTAVQAIAGDGRASVGFIPPANSGGSAITGYTVVASPGGITASGVASPIVVTGLSNGTAYTFSVVATSGLGRGPASSSSSAVTPLTPTTAPGAPTAVAGTAGNAQAVVSFNAPASNGGSAITGYTVTSSPGGITASGAASPITVAGLTNGTAYTFSVVATSAAGSGLASAASNAVTPSAPAAPVTVPGAPTAVAATAGNAQAVVSFTAPASNGGSAITSYTVTSSPGGIVVSGTASPISVAGLSNGTAYSFTVRATNAAGSGAASSASSAVTPVAPVTPSAVPGAPTAVTATPGNAQAVVGFTAPASNGGSAITSYTVTSSPGGATASGTASPITVAGLTNGTGYTFSVVATNGVGSGAASAASNVVAPAVPVTPPTAPGVPTAVAATAGNAQAAVSFNAPASNGGSAVTGYTVTSSPGGITASGAASPITVPGLTNGMAYTFSVVATNAAGAGAASAASSAVTPVAPITAPGAPTAVAASAGNAQAVVGFNAPASNGGSAITGYTVTSSPGGITASGAASPITVAGLTNGTAYTFSVVATNAVGNGAASAASSAVTPGAPTTVPGAATAVEASAGNAQAVVSFNAPASNGGSAITGYTVTSSPGGATASGGASPITVAGLTNGTAYTFTVRATNTVGSGAASAASSAVTPVAPTTVPGAPTAVAATAGNAQAVVSFNAPASNGGSAITGYTVTSSPGGVTASGGTSPITVPGLTNGTAYTFSVVAANAVGSGAASAASSAVTPVAPTTAPGAPTAVAATAGNAQAVVSFNAPASNGGSAITGYTVTSSPGGITASGGTSPITVPGLTNGTAYTFSVVATNAVGTGVASAASSAVTPVAPSTAPGAPTAVAATAGNAQALISFNAPASNGGSAITGYTVTSSPGGFTASGGASPITVPGLTNGTAYTFSVVATNAVGNGAASAASSAVTPAAPTTAPGAPTAVAATAGNAQAVVSFNAPASNGGSAITGYTVTSSPGGITASGGTSPITVPGLTNGTAYTFTVQATNAVGTGAASAASSAVTPAAPTTAPGAPTAVAATAGNAQAVVSFNAPASNGGSAITGYTVTSSPGGVTASGGTSPITVPGLTNGTAYTFSVVATNAVGNGAASAASAAVTPATAPGQPQGVVATPPAASPNVWRISFEAPASNGAAITAYTVTLFDSSGTARASAVGSGSSLFVDVSLDGGVCPAGLGAGFYFSVRATNAAGDGAAGASAPRGTGYECFP